MEAFVKKYQQKFKKIKEDMDRWKELQSRLISQYRNAASIIERLQVHVNPSLVNSLHFLVNSSNSFHRHLVIQDSKNYTTLNSVGGIEAAVFRKQMESLQNILLSVKKTLQDFQGIVLSLEKMYRNGRQLVKGGSNRMTVQQLQQRVGVKPCLADCLDGLMLLRDMHSSEYALKVSLVSALSALAVKPRTDDLGALQQLLVDQPNIPSVEVQCIFDVIFAEYIC